MEKKGVDKSIFSGITTIIPMADVQHIERCWFSVKPDNRTRENYDGINIITKHTRWDMVADTWSNSIYLPKDEAKEFLNAWSTYRHELEFIVGG